MQPSSCHAYVSDQYYLLLLIMTVQPQPCCYCRIRSLLLSAQHARAEASNTNSASTNSSVPHKVDPQAIFLPTWRVGRYTIMPSTGIKPLCEGFTSQVARPGPRPPKLSSSAVLDLVPKMVAHPNLVKDGSFYKILLDHLRPIILSSPIGFTFLSYLLLFSYHCFLY
jgi:hypothetical protein